MDCGRFRGTEYQNFSYLGRSYWACSALGLDLSENSLCGSFPFLRDFSFGRFPIMLHMIPPPPHFFTNDISFLSSLFTIYSSSAPVAIFNLCLIRFYCFFSRPSVSVSVFSLSLGLSFPILDRPARSPCNTLNRLDDMDFFLITNKRT